MSELSTTTGESALAANATIEGFYADPSLAVFDGRYYLYPTTDGTADWSASGFRAFSSGDAVSWSDHGEIFSLTRDTNWAKGNAWAPAMARKGSRYYFYFTADKSIGVAVSDSPFGPFVDLGMPLVDAGRYEGQMIDPSVFTDDDGQSYLYWGNTVAYAVPLGDDMMSFDPEQVVRWQPAGFREAAWVHRRGEVYYLSWSENDTRHEDYRVCYATSDAPLGPWTERGVLLEKAPQLGVLATGHHSIARRPDSDDWIIAYHRFAIPGGNGFHREIVVAPLVHEADGSLHPVDVGATRPADGSTPKDR